VSATEDRGQRKIRIGRVVSDKPDKTIVVEIERYVEHPLYKKHIRKRSKLHAHDEKNESHVGDTVRVIESRPMSRMKRWRLIEIVAREK
jgi:small subunit ribosomal protein S17